MEATRGRWKCVRISKMKLTCEICNLRLVMVNHVLKPPAEMLGVKVTHIRNFETESFRDIEGDEIPKEKMLIFELEDRTRIAVRGSGTEPKIKYYLFAQQRPDRTRFSSEELVAIKTQVSVRLTELWQWLRRDATARARG